MSSIQTYVEETERKESQDDKNVCHLVDDSFLALCFAEAPGVAVKSLEFLGMNPAAGICYCRRKRCHKCIAIYLAMLEGLHV